MANTSLIQSTSEPAVEQRMSIMPWHEKHASTTQPYNNNKNPTYCTKVPFEYIVFKIFSALLECNYRLRSIRFPLFRDSQEAM